MIKDFIKLFSVLGISCIILLSGIVGYFGVRNEYAKGNKAEVFIDYRNYGHIFYTIKDSDITTTDSISIFLRP